jgi:disulfide bond formation protein DsbB
LQVAGWILGIGVVLVGIFLYRYPSRYGRGFVQAMSLIMILGGVYVIWVSHLLTTHRAFTHSLF